VGACRQYTVDRILADYAPRRDDAIVTPLDALLVLNYLRQSAAQSLGSGDGELASRWSSSFAPTPTLLAVEDSEPEFEFDPSDLEPLADAWQSDSAWEDLVDRLAESSRSGNRAGLLVGASTEEARDHEALVDNALLDFRYQQFRVLR